MVIDEDSRTIVLEGKSGPRAGLTELLRKVGRSGPNGQAYRALENPDVRFSRRLYTCFDADLKKARKGWEREGVPKHLGAQTSYLFGHCRRRVGPISNVVRVGF